MGNAQGTSLGGLLRTARRARGWTQAEASQRLGRSQSWITQVERGVYKPALHEIPALAHLFGVRVSCLLAACLADQGFGLSVALEGAEGDGVCAFRLLLHPSEDSAVQLLLVEGIRDLQDLQPLGDPLVSLVQQLPGERRGEALRYLKFLIEQG